MMLGNMDKKIHMLIKHLNEKDNKEFVIKAFVKLEENRGLMKEVVRRHILDQRNELNEGEGLKRAFAAAKRTRMQPKKVKTKDEEDSERIQKAFYRKHPDLGKEPFNAIKDSGRPERGKLSESARKWKGLDLSKKARKEGLKKLGNENKTLKRGNSTPPENYQSSSFTAQAAEFKRRHPHLAVETFGLKESFDSRKEYTVNLDNDDYQDRVKKTPLRLWQHTRKKDGDVTFNVSSKDKVKFFQLANQYLFDETSADDMWGHRN